MSWAEDMGYDAFDWFDFHENMKDYWEETWVELKSDGNIWQDQNGKDYKSDEISDRHLLNILNFCKRSWRPEEQVEALKQIAKQRGLVND